MLRGLVRLIRYMDGLTSRADLQIVEELLREANVERDDMVEACKFSTQHYARNELAKSPWYQLLVICWRGDRVRRFTTISVRRAGFALWMASPPKRCSQRRRPDWYVPSANCSTPAAKFA